ncbi:MAG: hypothetical protein H7X89_06445 [Rhizobiales bacterium]|nr:hypothetical protein [Hyphomicrobiales bacterium]
MPLRIRQSRRIIAVATVALALSACSLMGDKSDVDVSTGPKPLAAADIRGILSGKSWRFAGPNNTGTTLYAADGTSLVEVDGKGKTTGRWQTQDGQLCESFDPATFLPSGVPMSCYPFSGGGGTYQVGKATFTLAG